MQPFHAPIHGLLLDLDGTLYEGKEWLPGALDTIRQLSARYALRFVTNTTTKNRRQVWQRFAETDLGIPLAWFFTPGRAAFHWLKAHQASAVFPLIHSNLREDLDGLSLVDDPSGADFVLVGDMGTEWTIDILHQGLRALLNGARLVALATNRHWKAADGYRLDAGAFVCALEYGAATQCEAVFGKPNDLFFNSALADMEVAAPNALMVGDDVESDVLGAERLGINGVLVKTGKYHPDRLTGLQQAVRTIDSIADLAALLDAD